RVEVGHERYLVDFFKKQKEAYEIMIGIVGSEICIREKVNIRYKTENVHNNKNSKRHPVIFYTNINDKDQKMIK
ncbi:hypothetical protein ACXQDM_12965, partial [Staphylococcus argenteus]